jgi:hypothetical protein
MRKIVEYKLLSHHSKDILVEYINYQLLKEGWQPLGGICYDRSRDMPIFFQAMVKYEEKEEE